MMTDTTDDDVDDVDFIWEGKPLKINRVKDVGETTLISLFSSKRDNREERLGYGETNKKEEKKWV